jgi:hypothetical protein
LEKSVRRGAAVLLPLLALGSAAQAAPLTLAGARLLGAHNVERRMAGAGPLRWDPRLVAAADRYAAQLARTGRFAHSPAHLRNGQGENLWMGTRGAFSPEAMVADWASEKRLFRPGVFPHVSRTGSWADVGHFSQMIWPSTVSVGCSVRSSRQWDFLVCRYASPGNVMGQRVGPYRLASR